MARHSGVTTDETKEQLLDAAASVFAEKGYDRARVADIAKAAGMTTGPIYFHYGNKADLLLEALRSQSNDAVSALISDETGSNLLDALSMLGRQMPRPSDERLGLLTEAIAASRREPKIGEVLKANMNEREATLVGLIEAAQEAGSIDPTVPPGAAARLISLIALGSLTAGMLGMEAVAADDWAVVINRLVDAARPPI